MSDKLYALSVKQPWAALLAAGVKTVEVRSWPTSRRGPLLIHASKVPDERPEAWAWVTTPDLTEAAKLCGGVVGVGELVGCVAYPTAAKFAADRGRHLNAPEWFAEAGLYGFAFRALRAVPFVACPGSTSFFEVEGVKL
jgi:hypothetical protein